MRNMDQDHFMPQYPNHFPQMTNQIQSNKKSYGNLQLLKKTLTPYTLSFKKMFKILVGIGQIIPIHQKLFLPPCLKQYESV
jgi:hypothetical protein